jgi:lipopolysaccharide assembly protein A
VSAERQPPTPAQHKIRHTRTSGVWFAVVVFAVLLVFLLIFIVQNERPVDITFLGAHWRLQLGVALLLAAVVGVLLAILAAVARMGQLRAVAKRHRRADSSGAGSSGAGSSGAGSSGAGSSGAGSSGAGSSGAGSSGAAAPAESRQ